MGRILLLHHSKVVRATLTRHLEGDYQILEALDGESAWQTLVLDHEVSAVIAGPDAPLLHGMELLERLRRNRLQRLKKIPFYFVGSEAWIAEIREQSEKMGATGFLRNDMTQKELLGQLRSCHECVFANSDANASMPAGAIPIQEIGARGDGLLSQDRLELSVRDTFARIEDSGVVLVFGVDDYSQHVSSLGKSVVGRMAERFAHMVKAKIGAKDFMGHCGPGCFAIVTRCHCLEKCEAFAQRIAKGLASAQIAVRGRPVSLSISSGAASRPEDGDLTGAQLLELAKARMEQAMTRGKGQVMVRGQVSSLRRRMV